MRDGFKTTLNEDSILMSESVVNWMTTQALCGEEFMVLKYIGMVEKKLTLTQNTISFAITQGFSNSFQFFLQTGLFALMNYRVSLVSVEQKSIEFKTLYEAMFCMLMGILSTRTTTNYLADIKKAMVAVRKIFDIIENDE